MKCDEDVRILQDDVDKLANLLAIIILSQRQCNLSRCVTYYLVAIAVADFLVIITGCILNRISRIYFSYSVLSTTPACCLNAALVYATRDCSVWLTVAFTVDRFIAICCQSLKTKYCTEKSASVIIGVIYALSCCKNIPFYFIYQPLYIQDGVPWFCDIKPTFHTSPAWQTYNWLDRILAPFLPFLIILLLNVLNVRHILVASRARKRLLGAENSEDTEMANRKRSIILLFTISLSFLLLWVTYIARFLYRMVTGDEYVSSLGFSNQQYILQETTNMLQLLSSCNNFFIYVVSQNKFREELKKVLVYPFTRPTDRFL
ncbi:probable G-protein coupled receptor 139 [Hemiscyllium ocellatum]|uniref:probable G-protein coupled receptor 139 n=1 Tax=Hemiscyllium ocellatum TaxID=170820 RepID=UPI002966B6A4|nr:probable G-protein coupled receptor 139 [Hemiscyllium ocellatum]